MAKTLKEINQMECNKRAREKYDSANFTRLTIKFKNEEIEAVNKYCLDNDMPKNKLIRLAVMQYIENNRN